LLNHSSLPNSEATTHDLSGIADDNIISTAFTDTITSLEPGKPYYVRVTARTDNSNNKFNYSDIIQINVP